MAHDYDNAFKIYEEMGESRSLKALSEKTRIPFSTLKKVSAKENWAHKLLHNREVVQEQVQKVVVSDELVGKVIDEVLFRKHVTNLVLLADQALNSGQIKFRTVSDLIKVYQLQLDLIRLSKEYEQQQAPPQVDNFANGIAALMKVREEMKKEKETKPQEETDNDNKIRQHFN